MSYWEVTIMSETKSMKMLLILLAVIDKILLIMILCK